MTWRTDDIPDLSGRRAVITGVTGGLGLHTALGLARKGADLVVTARDETKASTAVDRIRRDVPGASVDVVSLDLADLDDAKRASAEVARTYDRIDILVNNAGIMIPPRSRTKDGFELQIGTNHLGHFAWTAGLWPVLDASDARVVTVSSAAHMSVGGIDLTSLTPQGSSRRYRRWQSYAESKLANLLFALELDRRAKATGSRVVSVAAHPGYASTNLTKTGPSVRGLSLPGIGIHQVSKILGQPASHGAWPLLMAATDPSLTGGEYVGPGSLGGARGRPRLVATSRTARDEDLADAVWSASEAATGVEFRV
ncbi:oxidoreductase [Aeromicrobium chenweiae]|uniref:Short-chain dehydrogenase n=1 Tax=Aeromicrobium chenweiae TaxID=2079793 RepID=A0A2S0WR24_9ACTN|nr:oxidoreductase [Aeromicrobium chenweiae]AWB93813.1 short-chain dehydrogenase [Aeromicrobium chenweiae]TGN30858.1 SDR family NAD(P)-dependent oxidoreductase [Aeromicrobium chenweiae]